MDEGRALEAVRTVAAPVVSWRAAVVHDAPDAVADAPQTGLSADELGAAVVREEPKPKPEWLTEALDSHRLWVESEGQSGKRADFFGFGHLYEWGYLGLDRPDWSESIRGMDFSGVTLKGARLTHADMRETDLSAANLSETHMKFVDLSGADLSHADLSGADLGGAILNGANLTGACLKSASLRWTDLRGADLSGADLQDANLWGALTAGTKWPDGFKPPQDQITDVWLGGLLAKNDRADRDERADREDGPPEGAMWDLNESHILHLQGMYLGGADLTGADLSSTILEDTNLAWADLTATRIGRLPGGGCRHTSFVGASIHGVKWPDKLNAWGAWSQSELNGAIDDRHNRVSLAFADLRGLDLSGKSMMCIDMPTANLEGANLEKAYLSNADLSGANLRGARLGKSNLFTAFLNGANLEGADLRDAELFGADLTSANLRNADLRNARLGEVYGQGFGSYPAIIGDADLRGANLSGAYLRDLDLRNAKLDGACFDGACVTGVQWPEGFTLPTPDAHSSV